MTDAEPPVEPVTQSGAKTAKKAFEKVAKKKPDPAGLALAEEAQAALTGKDFATAKEKFQRAQALCEASDAKPAARPKPAKPDGGAGGAGQAKGAAKASITNIYNAPVLNIGDPSSSSQAVSQAIAALTSSSAFVSPASLSARTSAAFASTAADNSSIFAASTAGASPVGSSTRVTQWPSSFTTRTSPSEPSG